MLQKNAANLSTLHELRSLGVSIVLDDFGTGYSSLSYLRMFPFDKIKIDKSFVHELTMRAECAAIVDAVTALGRGLNMITTAEGVETEEQFALLRAAGVDHVQGYLFSHPCLGLPTRIRPPAHCREGWKSRLSFWVLNTSRAAMQAAIPTAIVLSS